MAFFNYAASQTIFNPGFEDWDVTMGDTVQQNWSTSGNGAGQSSDSYSGGFAAVVWNWYSYAQGILVNGNDQSMFNIIQAGTPVSGKPTKLSGFYKYEDVTVPGDSAQVIVILKKYNTTLNQIDTVGYAEKLLGSASSYTPFQVDITDMQPGIMPDSIVIAFYSSVGAFCQVDPNCSYLFIDDLALDIQTGIIDIDELFRPIKIYPNPFSTSTTLEFENKNDEKQILTIYNSTGALVRKIDNITNGSVRIERENLKSGLYFFQLTNTTKRVGSGKITIE